MPSAASSRAGQTFSKTENSHSAKPLCITTLQNQSAKPAAGYVLLMWLLLPNLIFEFGCPTLVTSLAEPRARRGVLIGSEGNPRWQRRFRCVERAKSASNRADRDAAGRRPQE